MRDVAFQNPCVFADEERVFACPGRYIEEFIMMVSRRQHAGVRPRVHGNGFIQLDMALPGQRPNAGDLRLHVWGDRRIPRQHTPSPIHDHIFSFTSQIIVGKLVNVMYSAIEAEPAAANYKVYEPYVRVGQDTGLANTGRLVYAMPKSYHMICSEPGYPVIYTMPWGKFHESIADRPAATLMCKDGPSLVERYARYGVAEDPKDRNPDGSDYHIMNAIDDMKPRVLVPLNREPNNDFRRDMFDENLLWQIIYEVLNGWGDGDWFQ